MKKARIFAIVFVCSVASYMFTTRDAVSLFTAPKPAASVDWTERHDTTGARIDQVEPRDPKLEPASAPITPPHLDEYYVPTTYERHEIAYQAVLARMMFGDRMNVDAVVLFERDPSDGNVIMRNKPSGSTSEVTLRGLSYAERRRAEFLLFAYHMAYAIAMYGEYSAEARADDYVWLCYVMTNDRSSGFSSEECRKGSASLSASAQTIAVKSEQDRLADFAAAAVNVAAPKVAALVKAMPERAPTTHEKDEYPGGYMFTTARLLSTATVVRLASGVDAPWSRCASANCAPLPALVAGSPYCPPVKPGAIMEVDAKSLVATCGAPHPTGLCTAALSAAATMVVAEAFQRDSGSLYEHFDVELKELDGELRAELLPDMLTEPIYAETVLHELDTSRRNIAIAMASSRMRSVLPNKRGPTRLNEDEKRQVVQDVCSLVTMERAGLKKAPTSYSLTLDANYNECSGPAMGQYVTVPDEIRSRYDEESARGGKCADAVIEANRATIEALAARLLKYPPSKTQPLVMNGHEVTQWFCEHPVIAPEKLPAGTESFCKR